MRGISVSSFFSFFYLGVILLALHLRLLQLLLLLLLLLLLRLSFFFYFVFFRLLFSSRSPWQRLCPIHITAGDGRESTMSSASSSVVYSLPWALSFLDMFSCPLGKVFKIIGRNRSIKSGRSEKKIAVVNVECFLEGYLVLRFFAKTSDLHGSCNSERGCEPRRDFDGGMQAFLFRISKGGSGGNRGWNFRVSHPRRRPFSLVSWPESSGERVALYRRQDNSESSFVVVVVGDKYIYIYSVVSMSIRE